LPQGGLQALAVRDVVRMERFELVVIPQSFKMGFGGCVEIELSCLSEFHGPLETPDERGARQVGATDAGTAESRGAVKYPRLGV
jgi:hypothetical protein